MGKLCWLENCVNNWEVESCWNGLTLRGHGCFDSMRNLGNFSRRDCTFECRDCCGVLRRPHSCVQATFVRHETQDTIQTYGSWLDSKYSLDLKFG